MGLTVPHETKRFTVDEVERLVELGIIREEEHLELLNGELCVMTAQGPTHSSFATLLHKRFIHAYGDGFVVREDKPLTASRTSQPEPDVVVVPGTDMDFEARHPRADETVLILEVAWTSQDYDLAKVPIYAAGGAPCLWLLDLAGRTLTTHERPTRTGRYRRIRELTENDTVELPAIGVTWRIADLLPRIPPPK